MTSASYQFIGITVALGKDLKETSPTQGCTISDDKVFIIEI